MKKVLIFHTSIGLGHKTIAENIGWHLERAGFEVKLADILEVQSGSLVNVSTQIHSFINRRLPFLWSWLYTITNHDSISESIRVRLAGNNSQRAEKIINEFNPDLIISTHTTASAVVSYLKKTGQYKKLFAITFSDFHLHRYWLYNQADFYLANIIEQKQKMVELGIDEKNIYVCGITLKHRETLNIDEIKTRLNINPKDSVALFASGSLGIGSSAQGLLDTVNSVASKLKPEQNFIGIIVCGKNQQLKTDLEKLNNNPRIKVFGYYSPMSELYSISDIFVTKPGGLSVSESLQWNLPLLITHYLPGQEKLNYNYLYDRQIIMPLDLSEITKDSILKLIVSELETHEFKNSLKTNQHRTAIVSENQDKPPVVEAILERFHGFDEPINNG
jgi:processive 1,2-diacylglycerol beta-glucosyltransferase